MMALEITPADVDARREEAADLVGLAVGGPADPSSRAVQRVAEVLAERDAEILALRALAGRLVELGKEAVEETHVAYRWSHRARKRISRDDISMALEHEDMARRALEEIEEAGRQLAKGELP